MYGKNSLMYGKNSLVADESKIDFSIKSLHTKITGFSGLSQLCKISEDNIIYTSLHNRLEGILPNVFFNVISVLIMLFSLKSYAKKSFTVWHYYFSIKSYSTFYAKRISVGDPFKGN